MSEDFAWPGAENTSPVEEPAAPAPSYEKKKDWSGSNGNAKKWNNDKKWEGKKSTWVPRLPLYATVISNADITEHESKNLVQISQFLVSKGFKIRYAAHNKGLASLLIEALATENLESYVPWKGFDDIENANYFTNTRAKDLMGKLNSSFKDLPNPTQNIIGINCSLMYGGFCESPSSLLVVHTSDGCTDYKSKTKETGYASSAIELANKVNMPVFNTGNELTKDRFTAYISKLENIN